MKMKNKPNTDMTGKRFSNLLVVSISRVKKSVYYWNCICDCGSKISVRGLFLRKGIKKDCGCSSRLNADINDVIRRYKRQASERGLKFDLSSSEVKQILFKKCHYCGVSPSNTTYKNEIKYSGIDRIFSHKGYYKSNCVPACVRCNRAKGNRDPKDFIDWIERVYFYYTRDPEF